MNRKVRSSAVRSFVMIMLVATTLASTIRDHEINSTRAQDQTSRSSAVAPPLILAQGRCFNGRCY
jgi:hypothetical protein